MPAKRDGIRFGRHTDFLTRTIEALLFDRMLRSRLKTLAGMTSKTASGSRTLLEAQNTRSKARSNFTVNRKHHAGDLRVCYVCTLLRVSVELCLHCGLPTMNLTIYEVHE